jgi:hypothetical protein
MKQRKKTKRKKAASGAWADLKRRLGALLNVLTEGGWPDDCIASHHGVGFQWEGFDVAVAAQDGRTTVMVYDRRRHPGMPQTLPPLPASWSSHVARVCAEFGKVADQWNGGGGCWGVSVVINCRLPRYEACVARYHALGSRIFEETPEIEAKFAGFTDAIARQRKRFD